MRRLVLMILLAACSGGDTGKAIDAAPTPIDAIDAASLPPGDAQKPIDAAAGSVACGTDSCSSPDVCCVAGGPVASMCVAACHAQAFACDGPEDCPGQVCCEVMGGGSECKAAAQCTQPKLCHQTGECGAGGGKCCALGQTEYKVCTNVPQCF